MVTNITQKRVGVGSPSCADNPGTGYLTDEPPVAERALGRVPRFRTTYTSTSVRQPCTLYTHAAAINLKLRCYRAIPIMTQRMPIAAVAATGANSCITSV